MQASAALREACKLCCAGLQQANQPAGNQGRASPVSKISAKVVVSARALSSAFLPANTTKTHSITHTHTRQAGWPQLRGLAALVSFPERYQAAMVAAVAAASSSVSSGGSVAANCFRGSGRWLPADSCCQCSRLSMHQQGIVSAEHAPLPRGIQVMVKTPPPMPLVWVNFAANRVPAVRRGEEGQRSVSCAAVAVLRVRMKL